MIDYTKLKRGDVLAITNYNNRLVIVDKIKCDKTYSSPQIYTYAELDNGLYITFKKHDMYDFYLFENIIVRHATEDEKNTLYNAIGKHFTEEYDKDWYNHFTDSSYFDILDFLLDVFCIKIEEYDDDLIYPDFINEIKIYIWKKLCKSMGYEDEYNDEFGIELVDKKEFIAKAVKYLEANFPDIENAGGWYKCNDNYLTFMKEYDKNYCHKTSKWITENVSMECYEPTETTQLLDRMVSDLNTLLENVKNNRL